jgi:hypothetical protein
MLSLFLIHFKCFEMDKSKKPYTNGYGLNVEIL